ncbi:hypothetical protein ACIBG7_18380 [Nonomuraea sp. NPDC050328]|uniref:hypothetical protein n=1 Tax=Nonomuraea sp. NPDC050328 TaxID=3364361 RepID=UPI0037A16F53
MRFTFNGTTLAMTLLAVTWLHPPGVLAAGETDPAERLSSAGQSFSVDLTSAGESQHNIDHTTRGLRLPALPVDLAGEEGARHGFYVSAAFGTAAPTHRVRPVLSAQIPPGSDVLVEIRGQTATNRWTEWREFARDAPEVVLPRSVVRLQARITLERHTASGPGPEVHSLRLLVDPARTGPTPGPSAVPTPTATPTATPTPQVAPELPLTSRVYATRIGQIGDKTANGHTIRSTDRFAALPSRRALNAGIRDKAYEVKICYAATSRCATAPIWDVGPWNIRDDYWNGPDVREMWRDLPQGKPQAQAAYLDGYNQRRDDRSRQVRNPAGIDLADRLFLDDLGMTTNDWVMVTYLWTGDDEALV